MHAITRAAERLYYAVARRIDAARPGNHYSLWCLLGHFMALVPASLAGYSAHDALTDRLGR